MASVVGVRRSVALIQNEWTASPGAPATLFSESAEVAAGGSMNFTRRRLA
jgi:hypothetical protein